MSLKSVDAGPSAERSRVHAARGFLGALLLAGIAWMAVTPPAIFSDSVSGFLVLRSMEQGAPFNHTIRVDQDDISQDLTEFTSWWTPGQWLVVWPITRMGLDLGASMSVVTALAWALGLWGWWHLFRRLGFRDTETGVAVGLIAVQPWVVSWALFYHGGELLQWAWFPWFASVALRSGCRRWSDVPLLAAALVVGLVAKSSFLIMGAAALAGSLAVGLATGDRPGVWTLAARVARAGTVVAVGIIALYGYSSLGESPAGTRSWSLSGVATHEVLFALAAPLNSVFDLWRLYVPATEDVRWVLGDIRAGLAATVLAEVALVALFVRYGPRLRGYASFVAVTLGAVTAAFALAFSLDLLISFHARHARVAGLLLVPGVVAWVGRIRPGALRASVAAAGLAGCVALSLWSLDLLARDPLARPVGRAGFSHIYAGQDVVDALDEIDAKLRGRNALIVVPWPQLGLEVRHARIFDSRVALEGAERLRHAIYYGRVDDLVVVAPAPNGETAFAELIARAFREHDAWRRLRPELEGYVFLHSGTATDLE